MEFDLTTAASLIMKNSRRSATLCRSAFRHNLEEMYSVPTRVGDEMTREANVLFSGSNPDENGVGQRFWYQKLSDISFKFGKAHNCITLTLESDCVVQQDHPIVDALVIWLRDARTDINTLQIRIRAVESPVSNKDAIDWNIIENLQRVRKLATLVFEKKKSTQSY